MPIKRPSGDTVKDIEEDIGLPAGFFRSLLDDDDWSFVIKTHSLLEAALIHLLTDAVGRGNLGRQFGWLDTSDSRTGKLAFSKAMSLVTREQERFVRCLSELRNRLVHDIKNVSFSFDAYLGQLNASQIQSFTMAITGPLEQVVRFTPESSRLLAVRKAPKTIIWASTELLVADAYRHRLGFEIERMQIAIGRQRLAALGSPTDPIVSLLQSLASTRDEGPNES